MQRLARARFAAGTDHCKLALWKRWKIIGANDHIRLCERAEVHVYMRTFALISERQGNDTNDLIKFRLRTVCILAVPAGGTQGVFGNLHGPHTALLPHHLTINTAGVLPLFTVACKNYEESHSYKQEGFAMHDVKVIKTYVANTIPLILSGD